MNERIKELAEQAGIHPSNFESDADIKEPLEKFAELIVLECIDQFCYRGAVSADGDIVIAVKEHFGVEE